MTTREVVSLAQVRAKNAHVDDGGYLTMMLVRPLAPPLAWLALRAGLRPRTITFASFFGSWLITAIIAFGGRRGAVIGLALVLAWEVLDVMDGTMARALGMRDNFAGFVDYAAGLVLIAMLPIALGVAAYAWPDGSLAGLLPQASTLDHAWPVAAGGASAIVALLMRLVNRVIDTRFGDSFSNWGEKGSSLTPGALIDLVVRNLETVGGVRVLLTLALALAGWLEIAVAGYFVLNVLLLAAFCVSTYRKYRGHLAYPTA